jgi:hypothetical protein
VVVGVGGNPSKVARDHEGDNEIARSTGMGEADTQDP